MSEEDLQLLLQFFKVMADESRLKIVGILSTGECSVGELAERLGLKEPTVSHHLARLKELDLVEMRAEGNSRLYRLNRQALDRLNQQMFSQEQITSLGETLAGDDFDRKVFKDYLEDGRLKQIPTRHKKLLVILRWLMTNFEPGREYTEREVNAIIDQFHPDFATLRRALIDQGYLERAGGVYWVAEDYPQP
ncbi:MAG: metalloregulator ArsR/SmtB family transcription factor [Chloroflexi bacterium]|jgi:hypothetical protein|nr:metalloregulator ArsR/SmtB family transcription factor [Chloroflexota bacterium]